MAEYECLEEQVISTECERLKEVMDPDQLAAQAALFKVLGDLNRVKIMHVLTVYERLCVYEISRLIDATVATTSHHLITLRTHGIIRSEKEGKHVIYSLDSQLVSKFIDLANRMRGRCPKCGKIHEC